jgi:DNA mismatch endonuclease (patch repair protein)
MTDVHDTAIRSRNMRAIKGKNTRPEILIRKALHACGLRFRLHNKDLPGSPDLVLKKYKVLIFINGCFWHGHKCHLSKVPSTRTDFWLKKISANISRDAHTYQALLQSDWRFAVIWECALKGRTKLNFSELIAELEQWIIERKIKSIEFYGKMQSANKATSE